MNNTPANRITTERVYDGRIVKVDLDVVEAPDGSEISLRSFQEAYQRQRNRIQSLLGGAFPDEGWWALARRLERLTRPEFLVAVEEFLIERAVLP